MSTAPKVVSIVLPDKNKKVKKKLKYIVLCFFPVKVNFILNKKKLFKMKDDLVFYIFIGGGLTVLFSYWYRFKALKKVSKAFSSEDYSLWLLSAFFTTISVIYLFYFFSFEEKIENWERTVFLSSQIIFFIGAAAWSSAIYYKNIQYEKYILYVVALSTLGLLVSIIYSSKSNFLVVISAFIVFFHHLFYDSLKWIQLEQKFINNGSRKQVNNY